MSPSGQLEATEIALAKIDVPRFERVAVLIGLTTLFSILAVGLVLYLVEFQVDYRIVNVSLAAIAVVAVTTFFRIQPASRLTPKERALRGRRQDFFLLGILVGAAILGSIAAAAELDTPMDWFMLFFIASSPISIFFLVNVHFGMG